LNKWKKAISTGMSAALLASLFTFVAASSALASVTVTSAGNVPQNGTSAGTATFVLQEQDATSLTNAAGSIDIVINPAAPIVGTVTFSGTAVVSAPGSLGASASYVGNTLTVSWTNSDVANVESISVSGLTIDASATATPGAITATLANPTGNGSIAAFQAGGTASGVLAAGVAIGNAAATVNVTTTGCAFVATAGAPGAFAFAAGAAGTTAESLEGTATALPVLPAAQVQTLTITTAGGFTSVHNAGDTVTQTNACAASGVLASPGTVVQALVYNNPVKATVFPGENNSPATNLVLVEPAAGFLAAGTTFTYTISTAGVVFSAAPTVSDSDATMVLSGPVLAADRKSATVTVSTASAAAATITLSGILYDVAATVPGGTFIAVGVATSAGKVVLPASRTNAVVFRGIGAISATNPTVYIGENSQAAGLISFTEAAAGFFTDGTGSNNTFTVCPFGVTYTFTLAPFAKVTGGTAAGNLILREGAVASPDNIVQGTLTNLPRTGCYTWTVWTKSTTATTIQIGNSDFTSGPIINVGVNQPPGAVMVDLYIGDGISVASLAATVQFATAAFRNQVTVTALAQPAISAGSTNALAGNIQIAETGLGQLKNGEWICVEILPRALTTGTGTIQDTFLSTLNTANVPIATVSGSGLLVGPVDTTPTTTGEGAQCPPPAGGAPGTFGTSFAFQVGQQSTAGDGKIVISNIHYTTTADAANGSVLVRVSGLGGSPTVVQFQSTVSNARIGSQLAGTAGTRLGVTQVGAFSTSTKVAKVGKYVTYRFDFGVGAAGKAIRILGATKVGNDWSAFAVITTRTANASGVVYYYIRQNSATWKSYRGMFVDGGVFTPARQARWIP
jgi:hypothetical protein